MTFNQTVDTISASLLIVFNIGIVVRVMIILMDGQSDEEQPTKKMVINHLKAAVIVNIIGTFILVIKSYYQ